MKTYVYIDNFRGFSDALVPLTQVNFLVGENSTGKTSFLELIENFSNISFWLFEPRYGFPGSPQRHFLDLVSASSRQKKKFSVGAVCLSESEEENTFGMLVTYSNSDGRPVPTRISVIHGKSIRTVDGRLWLSQKGTKYKFRVCACEKQSSDLEHDQRLQLLIRSHKSTTGFALAEVSEEREGTPMFIRFEEALFGGKDISERQTKAPFPLMHNLVELAPIRTKPRRTYDAPQTEFSPEGDHTPYVIRKFLSSKSLADSFKEFLDRAGNSSGLFQSVSIKPYGRSAQAPFEMQIVLGNTELGLENVGYGVSQALPVLVEMFVRPKRTTFTVQQPEVHLHPRAQAAVGDIIAELARSEEKRFFVETHSDFTIDRFRLNVRKDGAISSQLLFFLRTDTGNKVIPITIQENGDLSADQPEEYRAFFFNESLSLLS